MKEVTKQTISYVLDLVDPAVKGKWPWMVADQAAFAESKMGHKRQHQGKWGVEQAQTTIPEMMMLATPVGGVQAGTSTSPQLGA